MAEKGQSRTARRKQKKTSKKPIWKKILLIALIGMLAIGIGVGALFTYYISTAPEIDASKLDSPYSSKIYDKDGDLFADLGATQRTKVEYSELPDVLIDAVIATEDSRFFEHPGVDIWRIGGAVIANITQGFGSEGASTITQQLVEKSFLSPEKKISLKVQEMWLALQLEQEYTKKQILEMYLNKIYYGSGAYGVAKAAEVYFGKTDLSKLTLPEAAILAGLPQRPSAYNPFKNPELMKERMNIVLSLMVQHGKITEEQAAEAKKVDIPSLLSKSQEDPTPYEAFLQRVQKEVKQKLDGADIYTDGLKIYTTIDTKAQEYVEFLLSNKEDNPINYPGPVTDSKGNEVNMKAGMVVLDSKTGAIRAIGGDRNGMESGDFNYATDISRQPGSTFKPVIAYGPAIENQQWSTYHQLNDDGPYEIKGSDQKIHTWVGNGHYYGWVSMRFALRESLNVPAAKTLEEVGYGTAQKFAESIGITFNNDNISLTDAIGGSSSGASPMELAGAYRAFANEGIYNEPYAVTKVVFPDSGREVNLKPEPEAVMSDYTAYMITDMLKTAVNEGTGKAADVPGLPLAGKTGTTNLEGKDGSPDSWFSGYTTNYTISTWTGYDDQKVVLPDTKIAQDLFRYTMQELSKDIETPDFQKPDSVVEVAVEEGTKPAKLPSENTPESKIVTELFVKGNVPSETSEKYKQLDPVKDLKAEYNKDANSIEVAWKYGSAEDITFEVSASVNGGQMQSLSSTNETSLEISNVEPGAEYEIQVVAVSEETEANASEPVTTTVKVPGENDEDEENEGDGNGDGNLPPVGNLKAAATESKIDVSWSYDDQSAKYVVVVSRDGNKLKEQTVNTEGIVIEGNLEPGATYTITVTPTGQDGNTGPGKSTSAKVPGGGDTGGNDEDGGNGGGEGEGDTGGNGDGQGDGDTGGSGEGQGDSDTGGGGDGQSDGNAQSTNNTDNQNTEN
ncbi:PBP1A family penicillin-binding protein [Virgibacillus kekensis]|uniref:PBP1A family penicillin-binding protein n=1 Tax=Virgibacillus kekensis TaxID=202261 RepID=A0ABV9DHL3_9BACI